MTFRTTFTAGLRAGISWWTGAVTDTDSYSNNNGYLYAYGDINTYGYSYSSTHANAKICANAETAPHAIPPVVIWLTITACGPGM